MAAIDAELQALKDNLIDMLDLVRNQLVKCKKVIGKRTTSLAEEVVADEKRVNRQELTIDRDCENILALHNPVATDLRFVLSTLRITNELERIGDNASKLAGFMLDHADTIPGKWLEKFNIEAMLEILTDMLQDMGKALRKQDPKIAVQTTKNDEQLNKYFKKAFRITSSLLADNPTHSRNILMLFTITRDLERAGDRTKNIAEEIVFHIEARVIKHSKG